LADLPGISFVVAYDPQRLSELIFGDDARGASSYLDKIFQLRLVVPSPTPNELRELAQKLFSTLIAKYSPTERLAEIAKGELLSGALLDEVLPLLDSLRALVRLQNSVALMCEAGLEGLDLFIPDAIRLGALALQSPDALAQLCSLRDILLQSYSPEFVAAASRAKTDYDDFALQRLSDALPAADREVRLRVLKSLFPGLAKKNNSEVAAMARICGRVASPAAFDRYFLLSANTETLSPAGHEQLRAELLELGQQCLDNLPADWSECVTSALPQSTGFALAVNAFATVEEDAFRERMLLALIAIIDAAKIDDPSRLLYAIRKLIGSTTSSELMSLLASLGIQRIRNPAYALDLAASILRKDSIPFSYLEELDREELRTQASRRATQCFEPTSEWLDSAYASAEAIWNTKRALHGTQHASAVSGDIRKWVTESLGRIEFLLGAAADWGSTPHFTDKDLPTIRSSLQWIVPPDELEELCRSASALGLVPEHGLTAEFLARSSFPEGDP
jgi:hypothetical protein